MKILLKKDVKNLGFKNDQLNVKSGYARNYLIPKGFAVKSSPGLIKNIKELLNQRSKKVKLLIEKSKDVEKKLKGLNIKILAKSDKNGKLFGSIGSQQIQKYLQEKGIFLEKKFIRIPENKVIKSIGKYKAIISLHKEYEFFISFEVLTEKNFSNKNKKKKK